MLEGKNDESEEAGSCQKSTQDTSGLSRQCSATEPQRPDNHQRSQSMSGFLTPIWNEKTTQHGFFPDGENFLVKQSSDGT